MNDRKKPMTFASFGLPKRLTTSLEALGFKAPTPIQEKVIPCAWEGRDILGTSETGSGKTGAFGIPLSGKLLQDPEAEGLVITPTRELATQVHKNLTDFLGRSSPVKSALLIGGDSIGKQCQHLRRRPRLFVGTPGRILDHLQRKSLNLQRISYLVLDETDRMLDMGFNVQIEKILKHLPEKRQTLLFSATLPKNILKLSETYLTNPVRLSVGSVSNPAANIDQQVRHLLEKEKYGALTGEVTERGGSLIIFVKTKFGTERMAKRLREEGHQAEALHGDLKHRKREKVIRDFRNRRFRMLVATDVAARGLDIPHIEHVINYDLPQCPEDYIHRIGRTARAGAKGQALCFVSPPEKGKWVAIQRLLDPTFVPPPRERAPSKNRRVSTEKRFFSHKKSSFSKESRFQKPRFARRKKPPMKRLAAAAPTA